MPYLEALMPSATIEMIGVWLDQGALYSCPYSSSSNLGSTASGSSTPTPPASTTMMITKQQNAGAHMVFSVVGVLVSFVIVMMWGVEWGYVLEEMRGNQRLTL